MFVIYFVAVLQNISCCLGSIQLFAQWTYKIISLFENKKKKSFIFSLTAFIYFFFKKKLKLNIVKDKQTKSR